MTTFVSPLYSGLYAEVFIWDRKPKLNLNLK